MQLTEPLREEEFAVSAQVLAPDLLSCVLIHGETAGVIVETEAYLGADDLAAHSSRGKTKRTQVIFGPPGRAYVYVIYGMHECLNVVADQDGVPGCVLIRALEPVAGIEIMRKRRSWSGPVSKLANGPGKLTEALAINRSQYGVLLTEGELTVRRWKVRPGFKIDAGPRIGIRECIDWPLRFTWSEHPCLSKAPAKGQSVK